MSNLEIKPLFTSGDGYAERAFGEYQRMEGKADKEEFLLRAAEMHHFLEDSHIFGMECRTTAWTKWHQALRSRMLGDKKFCLDHTSECSRIFYAVDHAAPYT